MRKKTLFPGVFLVFLFISIVLLWVSKSPGISFINRGSVVLSTIFQKGFGFSSVIAMSSSEKTELNALKEKNRDLTVKLIQLETLQRENAALRDQFALTDTRQVSLLPARIIGKPSFIPGVSLPEYFILDKGTSSKVKVGDTVIYKNNIVGTVVKADKYMSIVALVYSKSTSVSVRVSQRGTVGIIKGLGQGEMVLQNVAQAEKIKENDVIVTTQNTTVKGRGFAEDMIIGKISKIEKNPTSLFQTATVQSYIDFSHLTTVFIMLSA